MDGVCSMKAVTRQLRKGYRLWLQHITLCLKKHLHPICKIIQIKALHVRYQIRPIREYWSIPHTFLVPSFCGSPRPLCPVWNDFLLIAVGILLLCSWSHFAVWILPYQEGRELCITWWIHREGNTIQLSSQNPTCILASALFSCPFWMCLISSYSITRIW